jgi:hypothetical protein
MRKSYKKIKTDLRSTKWLDTKAKLPRNVARAQERNGTTSFNTTPSNALSKRGRPPLSDPTRVGSSGAVEGSRSSVGGASVPKKPKIAPMMAKTLKLARGLNRGGGFRR